MSWLTEAEAQYAFNEGRSTNAFAEAEIRKSSSTDLSANFDVFLSHSYLDARLIAGVKVILESEHLTVYVDWQNDAQQSRSNVTPDTAELLRNRMQHCSTLIFVATNSSPTSKWMPWELGYFDGFRPGHVAILPLMKKEGDAFNGQEYLGLYPALEYITFNLGVEHLCIWLSPGKANRVHDFVTKG